MLKMRLFKVFILFFIFFIRMDSFSSDDAKLIKEINEKAANIKTNAEGNMFEKLLIQLDSSAESGPMLFEYYFEGKNERTVLVLAKVKIGHEMWKNEFYYFFDEFGRILKFEKSTLFREDKPPKRAIIFNDRGKVIWSNYESKIPMEPEEVKKIIKLFLLLRGQTMDVALKHGEM